MSKLKKYVLGTARAGVVSLSLSSLLAASAMADEPVDTRAGTISSEALKNGGTQINITPGDLPTDKITDEEWKVTISPDGKIKQIANQVNEGGTEMNNVFPIADRKNPDAWKMGEINHDRTRKQVKELLKKYPDNEQLKLAAKEPKPLDLGDIDMSPHPDAKVFEDKKSGVTVSFRRTQTGARIQVTKTDLETGEKLKVNFHSEAPNIATVQTQIPGLKTEIQQYNGWRSTEKIWKPTGPKL